MESNALTMTSTTKFHNGVLNNPLIGDIHQKPFRVSDYRGNHRRRRARRHDSARLGAAIAAPASDHRETEAEQRDASDHQITAPTLELGLADGKPRRAERGNRAERYGNHSEDQKHRRLRLRSQGLCYATGR